MNITNYEMFEEAPRENKFKPQQNVKLIQDREILGGT